MGIVNASAIVKLLPQTNSDPACNMISKESTNRQAVAKASQMSELLKYLHIECFLYSALALHTRMQLKQKFPHQKRCNIPPTNLSNATADVSLTNST